MKINENLIPFAPIGICTPEHGMCECEEQTYNCSVVIDRSEQVRL